MAHTEITDDNFQAEVLDYKGLVLLDFGAPWCPHCETLGPIIEEISNEMSDKAKVCKINVDIGQQTASKYNVLGIPTVIFFKNGEVVERIDELRPKDDYVQAINRYSA